MRRLLLLIAGLALAARLAIGAAIPLPDAQAAGSLSPLAMLQAAMVLCHGPTPAGEHPPSLPHQQSTDEAWLADQSEAAAAILVTAVLLPPPPSPVLDLGPARPHRARAPPAPYRAMAFARGPPTFL
jgi:hypothetical protein